MKFLFLVSMFFTSTSVFSAENFFRASEGEVLLQGGYTLRELSIDYASEVSSIAPDTTHSFNSAIIQAEYGFTSNIAAGLKLSREQGPDTRGIADYEFYLKGQYQDFFYEGTFNFSHEKQDDENVASGGNHFEIEVGYLFGQFGITAGFQPEYDYKVKNDDSDFIAGSFIQIAGFYEWVHNKNIYGIAISHATVKADTRDGEDITFGSKLVGLEGYGNFKVNSFEILPAVRYFKSLDIDSNQVDEFSGTELELMLRYRF